MADNVIQRVIKMLLDKQSAKQTQDDANAVADGIDKGWKAMATKVAGYLSAAFLVNAIKNFGEASVKEAAESQATWAALGQTIDNTGDSFDKLQDKLRDMGNAFQDATIHDDDAFAESLTKLITITGDTSASINNMGLVANVAAQFFKGDLAQASETVGKVMNGNITILQRMGIHVTNAQQGLELLASRSFGAAERETKTFSGQLSQMNELWKDFEKDVGNAIISSDGSTDSISTLKAAIQTLTTWVDNNKKTIQEWVTNGIKFAIDAADVLIRAVSGMTDIIGGGLTLAWAAATKAGEGWIRVAAAARSIDAYFATGDRAKKFQDQADSLNAIADSLSNIADESLKLGNKRLNAGVQTLSTPLFSSDQFANAPKSTAKLATNPPQLGKNVSTDDTKTIQDAIKAYTEGQKAVVAMQQILGPSFDATNATIKNQETLLIALAEHGTTPAAQGLGDLADQYAYLKDLTGPVNTALVEMNKSMGTDAAVAIATRATATEALTAQIGDVQKAIDAISKTPLAEGAADTTAMLIEKIKALKLELADAKQADDFTQALKDMGDAMQQDLSTDALDGVDALTKLKKKQDELHQAILVGIKDHKTDTQSFKDLQKQYKETTDAINEQTLAMQFQAAAADFLADALGTALAGGLHEAAAAKAKQNAIEAAEMLVRAGAFALFGQPAQAGAALALAAQFAGVAAAWGILAAATGGGGGSAAAPAIASGSSASGGSGGDDLTTSRSTSSSSTQNKQPVGAEVSIYMVGPGFDMLNPQVQRVVRGAQQFAQERYGDAPVRVIPTGSTS